MTDKPHIPAQFIAPNPYQDWHDPEPATQHERPACHRDCDPSQGYHYPDCAQFRHLDGSPSQIPKLIDAPERDAEAVAATPAAAAPNPEAPDTDGPVPIAAGTYALYDDRAGGYVLVIGTREGETHHKHIPARVVKMAEMAMGGNSPLAAMFGAG